MLCGQPATLVRQGYQPVSGRGRSRGWGRELVEFSQPAGWHWRILQRVVEVVLVGRDDDPIVMSQRRGAEMTLSRGQAHTHSGTCTVRGLTLLPVIRHATVHCFSYATRSFRLGDPLGGTTSLGS
eukprot:scaffold624_cov402-Prasinococcus_capsulatus_cf.AAC.75